MNNLPGLGDCFFDLGPGSVHRLLGQIDGVRQNLTTHLNGVLVGTLLEMNAFGFEELTDISDQFVFIDFVHIR